MRARWLPTLALLLAGCTALAPATQTTPVGGLTVGGRVTIPATLVSNNSGGLVSNNSGGLVSNNSGGLVSNNSGGYRVQDLGQVPLASSLVYLLDPDERFYMGSSGQRLGGLTGEDGSYQIEGAPGGKPIFVAALLDGNRRVVGYTHGEAGKLKLDVNVASTYVTEWLRAEARRAGKSLGAFPLSSVDAIVQETGRMLGEGQLGLPDLTIGESVAMNRQYVVGMGARRPGLLDLWEALVGRRPLVVTVVAGSYLEGADGDGGPALKAQLSRPTGLALDRDGALLVSDTWEYVIRRVGPDGLISLVAGGVAGTNQAPSARTGDPFATTMLSDVCDLAVDPDGNVIATFFTGRDDDQGFWVLCRKEGSSAYGFTGMQAGKIYRYGSKVTGFLDGDRTTTRFSVAHGLAMDDAGNLFIADRRNNLVRRIERLDGRCVTVAGKLDHPELGVEEFVGGGFDGDGPALQHSLHRPYSLAWRRTAGGEEVFVWDGYNNAIRRLSFLGQDYQHGTLTTLVGDGKREALDRINLLDAARYQAPDGVPGIAVDAKYDRLYYADYNSRRLRMLDLKTMELSTLVGGGAIEGDDEAAKIKLGHLGGLLVAPDHSLYFADTMYRVVRRAHLEHHLR